MGCGKEKVFQRLTVICLIFSCILSNCIGGYIEFNNEQLLSDETIRLKVSMVTEEDSLFGGSQPYFSIDHTIQQRDKTRTNGLINVLVYHSSQAKYIGYGNEDQKLYCCTAELKSRNLCEVEGRVIVTDNSIYNRAIPLDGTPYSYYAKFDAFNVSGVYYIKYFNCPAGNAGDVLINGHVFWINPFGQLSAELYPLLWFFGVLTMMYMGLGLIWLIRSAVYWDRLLMIQNCISGVIFLGMVESVTWYFDFLSYNSNGNFLLSAIFIGVLSSTLKRTVSRLLVLAVSLGYGVVKANLGTEANKVWILGTVYFFVSGIQQLILTYLREYDNAFLRLLASVFIFPAALLDTLFYYWIFWAISRTIHHLQSRKQDVKLKMYTNLYWILIVGATLTVFIVLLESLLVYDDKEDVFWNRWWEFQAYWHLEYYFILLAIAYLWRPTENNTRYAYVKYDDIDSGDEMDLNNNDLNNPNDQRIDINNDSIQVGEPFDFGINANEPSKMN